MVEAGTAAASAKFQRTTMLPDGEIVIPLERDGEIVWAVHPDHITPELCDALNRYISHITRHGLWRQQWDGAQRPPHHQQRQAS